MYKSVKIVIFVVMLIWLFTLVVQYNKIQYNVKLDKEEKEWIENNKGKEIVAKCIPDNGIYYTEDKNQTFGVFNDLEDYIKKLYGINIVTKKNPKEADILWALEINNVDNKKYISTKQYDFDSLKIYTSKKIKSLKDIGNRKIAIHESFNKTQSAYKKNINFVIVDDVSKIKKMYENGEVFGFIIGSSALKYLDISPEKQLYSKDISKNINLQILAYTKEDRILRNLIEKALSSVSQDKMNEIRINNQLKYIKYKLNLTDKEKRWLSEHKKIPMKIKYKFKPYYFENKLNKKSGILNEYINRVEYILGVNFVEDEDVVPQIYFGVNKKEEISHDLELMKPYNSYNLSIYSKYEMVVDSVSQLEGFKIGVVKNLDKVYLDSKIIYGEVKLYNDYDDMLYALEKDEIDYFVGDNLTMQYYTKNNITEDIFDVGVLDSIFYEYIGIDKNNDILVSIMKKLDNNINTEVLPKYNKNNMKNIDTIDYIFIIQIIVIFVVLILLSYIYILRLRKHIKVKEELQKDLKKAISNNEDLIMSLVETLEDVNSLNDSDTGNHIERISKYCEKIVRRISVDENFIKEVTYFSSLHDIGKVAICDSILKKPGKLTDEEMDIMKTHVSAGYDIIKKNNLSNVANNIILYHHERYDGEGYLSGLKGEEIPIEARIVAIADVYDALRMERCYKSGFSHEKSMDIIVSERGKQFDPKLVDILVEINEEFDIIFNESN
ncbi:MAG: HD domain-containing phosphohydrolase [Romboutsia sp.]